MSSMNATQIQHPDWLNSGDNAWQLTASSLVALQSVPGLVVIYAGLVKTKWAINSAFMCFYAFAAVMVCWGVWGYSMSFGAEMIPGLVGIPKPMLSSFTEMSQANIPSANLSPAFPMATLVYFQFVFAAITLILLAGSLLGRMNFMAWMLFVPLWLTFSYTVGAYALWGGGFLFQKGVLDFAGGYVIHVSSGTAGFVAAYWVGPRLQRDREHFKPNNTLLALVGAGILWVGWNGFNGGAPMAAGPDSSAAVLNTNLTTAVSLIVWMCLDIIFFKKPSVVGAIQGMITGLVAITPAAGLVAGWGAIIIGVFSGSIPWFTMNILGHRMKIFKTVDDTLGVFHTHLVAGWLGGVLVGIFATEEACLAFGALSTGGAITGNGVQIGWQLAASSFVIAWNVVVTSLICLFIKYVCRIPLRMSETDLLSGDDAVHGEAAYFLNDELEVTSGRPANHHDDIESGSGAATPALTEKKVVD